MVRLLVESGAAVFARTISDNETAAEKCEMDDDESDSVYKYLSGV
jgi:apoptosis-stimulating of p53 protein 1